MAAGRKPKSECLHNGSRHIDEGTSCRQESPTPGSLGFSSVHSGGIATNWRGTLDEWVSSAGHWVDHASDVAVGQSKSALLSIIDLVPFKQQSPISTALLKHYVERSGAPYEIDIPAEWQEWIVRATKGRQGVHKNLNPYNSGLYDLRNSLGHFDVTVTTGAGHTTYTISDDYHFGSIAGDKGQRGRHGFPLGSLTAWDVQILQKAIPSSEYANPGGFHERWEIKTVGKETILFIPQAFLAQQGTPFKVTGTFTR